MVPGAPSEMNEGGNDYEYIRGINISAGDAALTYKDNHRK